MPKINSSKQIIKDYQTWLMLAGYQTQLQYNKTIVDIWKISPSTLPNNLLTDCRISHTGCCYVTMGMFHGSEHLINYLSSLDNSKKPRKAVNIVGHHPTRWKAWRMAYERLLQVLNVSQYDQLLLDHANLIALTVKMHHAVGTTDRVSAINQVNQARTQLHNNYRILDQQQFNN